MPPTRFPFRLSDLRSHSKQAANEVAVIRAHFHERAPYQTCATCTCGSPRFCFEISEQGLARLSCEFLKVGYRHVVAIKPEHAGMSWPGLSVKRPELVGFNSAITYGLYRGFDVPLPLGGCVAGPVLTGGGTVYRRGSVVPVYPVTLIPAKQLSRCAKDFANLFDRLALTLGGPETATQDIVIEEEDREIKVAPMPKRLRFGGAA